MKKLLFSLFAITIISMSCSKEGPRGPQGPAGFDGLDGQVNIQAFEYEVLPSAWIESGVFGNADYGFFALADFPELTNTVLDGGLVLGYYILPDDGQLPMPAIFYNNGFSTNYDFILYPGEIEFYKRESDNETQIPVQAQYYKMVVVPGTFKTLPDKGEAGQTLPIIVVPGTFKTLPDFSKMTLPEVEEYLGVTAYKKVTIK